MMRKIDGKEIRNLTRTIDLDDAGREMVELMERLYPICRSITGNGVRETLGIIQDYIPLSRHEVPTGTRVFDWTVPKEWNIRDAFVKNSRGEKIIDFQKCNLHVMGYSVPVHGNIPLSELKKHLHTLPDHPDWIPYRTSYYTENWGICLSHKKLESLTEETYEVLIDSTLEDGHLTYGEYYIEGHTSEEVLLSCHVCHPSLCNDNLSGIALVAHLAKNLAELSLRYSYRFLFLPATIGPITWLSLNEEKTDRIKHGLVAACVGDPGDMTYKKTRRGDSEIDMAVAHVLAKSGDKHEILDFSPYGYDERQFCSPGFNLPVGCLMRTPNGKYPEYHTSADNLEFVKAEYLGDSFSKYVEIMNVLESNRIYLNTNPKCEPHLGKRGLYRSIGGQSETMVHQLAMLWVLNLSDGNHTLLDIVDRAGLSFDVIKEAADALVGAGLLEEIEG